MRVQLLKVLDKIGKDYLRKPQDLKFLLAPILVKNLEQQDLFYQLFDNYLSETQEALPQLPKKRSRLDLILRWIWILPLLVILGLVAYYIYINRPGPIPNLYFSHPSSVKVGDTIEFRNKSTNLHLDQKLVWELTELNGNSLRDTIDSKEKSWRVIMPTAQKSFTKTMRLSLLDPIEGNDDRDTTSQFTVKCRQEPLIRKGPWPDSIFVNTPINFPLVVEDDRPYTFEWSINGAPQSSKLDSLIVEEHNGFEDQGFYNIRVTATLENADGVCTKSVEHTITAYDDEPIAPLVEIPLEKIPDQSKAYFKMNWWGLLALFGLLPLWFFYKWLQFKKSQRGQKQPLEEIRQRFEAPDKPPYFIPFRPMGHVIHAGKELYEFANTLRQRQEGLRKQLNVEKSLKATIEKGGFPEIKEDRSTLPSEYLFLIDEQHRDSIQSRLYEYLVAFLKDKDVYAERYFYAGEPFSIWKKKESEGFDLAELHRLYPYHRLVVMGDAHRWLAQSSTDAKALNEEYTRSLQRWNRRTLLTPMPPVSWTYKEDGLHQWLPIFPSDMEGIEAAFDEIQEVADEESRIQPFAPRQQDQAALRPKEADVNYQKWRKVDGLAEYLENHPMLLQWVKALSVHPVISWDLTLAIGNALEPQGIEVNFNNLLILSRIPWLQQGSFPPRLRLQLLDTLDAATENIARKTVQEELSAVEKLTKNSFVNFDLQASLSIQNFLLDPENEKHKEAIRSLTMGDKPALGKHRYKELEQQIKKYQLSKGQAEIGLLDFVNQVSDQGNEETNPAANPFRKWLAISLLLWLGIILASMFVNGKDFLHQMAFGESSIGNAKTIKIDKKKTKKEEPMFVRKMWLPPSQIAKLNNEAVEIYERGGSIDSVGMKLNEAFVLIDTLSLIEDIPFIFANNQSRYLYNRGVRKYKSYFDNLNQNALEEALESFDAVYKVPEAEKEFLDKEIYKMASHGRGLVRWYQRDTIQAKAIYQTIDSTFFDTLEVQKQIPNLKTLLEPKEVTEGIFKNTIEWTGQVLDSISNKPLAGVLVTWYGTKFRTDQNGNYKIEIERIKVPRMVQLTFNLSDYQTKTIRLRLKQGMKLSDVRLRKVENLDTSSFGENIVPLSFLTSNNIADYIDTVFNNRPIKEVILKHTFTPDQSSYLRAGGAKTIAAIKKFNVEIRKYSEIGDHFYVGPDGKIWIGRSLEKGGAVFRNRNENSVGVAMIMNGDEEEPTAKQAKATGALLSSLLRNYNIEPTANFSDTTGFVSDYDLRTGGIAQNNANTKSSPGKLITKKMVLNWIAEYRGEEIIDSDGQPDDNNGDPNLIRIYFEKNRTSLNNDGQRILDELSERMRANENLKAEFSVYPNSGDLKVSEVNLITNRLRSIEKYLGSKGINGDRIIIQPIGERAFIQSSPQRNDDFVEIKIYEDYDGGSTNIFTDPRDYQTYKTVIIEKEIWMAENLNYKTADSWCYLELPEFCGKVGRLYTWEAAQKACPKGWHLPSDQEWKSMIRNYGGYYDSDNPKNYTGDAELSYKALIKGGESGFEALLGGERTDDEEYVYLNTGTDFWSATSKGNGFAFSYGFKAYNRKLFRSSDNENSAYSCRCIKD